MPKRTKLIMGMPITVEIVEDTVDDEIEEVFKYFEIVDKRYSTYKKNSEISKINGGLPKSKWSAEMRLVLKLCDQTKKITYGYFDARHNGKIDPSGLVKGWAINNAANQLITKGINNFYIAAGGDIQVHGTNINNEVWEVGIRNPFNIDEIIKVISGKNIGVATSGTYIRGQHIYDPVDGYDVINAIRSLTVIGPNIYEADRFATAAFAMGVKGIAFIDSIPDLEGYMVNADETATFTRGFERYVVPNA